MVVLWAVSDVIDQLDSHSGHISQTPPIVQYTINFSLLPRHISILLEETLNFADSLINTTTRFDMSHHFLFIVLYHCGFSHNNLSDVLDEPTSWIESAYEYPHFVFYPAFAFPVGCFVLYKIVFYCEWGWVVFPGLIAEREYILSWWDELATEVMEDVGCFDDKSSSRSLFNSLDRVADLDIAIFSEFFLALLWGGISGIHLQVRFLGR